MYSRMSMILIPSFRVIFAVHNVCMYSVYAIYTHRELQREHIVQCVQVFLHVLRLFCIEFWAAWILDIPTANDSSNSKAVHVLCSHRLTNTLTWSVCYAQWALVSVWVRILWIPQRHTLNHLYTRQNPMHGNSLTHTIANTLTYWCLCICACVSYEMSNLTTNLFIHVKQMYTFKFFYFSFPFDIHMRIALMTNTNCNRLLIRWVCRERLPSQTINCFVGLWIFL